MGQLTKFNKAYWTVNIGEMLERTAYYAIFIAITFYLSNILGFSDIEAGIISGLFSAFTYFLQMFSGAYADRLGYRKSMLLAFGLMPIAYLSLGLLPYMYEGLGLVKYEVPNGASALIANMTTHTEYTGLQESGLRWLIIPVLLILVVTGSITKSIISSSCVVKTQLTRLIGKMNPEKIEILAPVMYKDGKPNLIKEFPDDISAKFNFITFAVDDSRDDSGSIVPGVGGMVYPRLGLGDIDQKNSYIPDMVLERI